MSRPTPNTIAHFDISGPNAGALEAFYAGLFGWAVLS